MFNRDEREEVRNQIVSSKLNDKERDTLIMFLQNLIRKNDGSVTAAMAGSECLSNRNISMLRRRFSSLKAMLDELYPDIDQEKRDGALYITSGRRGGLFSVLLGFGNNISQALANVDEHIDNAKKYPEQIDVTDSDVQDAIQYLRNFAYLGWPNQMVKKLKSMTGYSGNKPENWLGIIGLALRQAINSRQLKYHNIIVEGKEEKLCIFSTGLVNRAKQTIYFVLKENTPEYRQQWALADICSQGENDTVYSSVLADIFPSESASLLLVVYRRQRLKKMVTSLKESYENIKDSLVKLSQGCLPDSDALGKMDSYLQQIIDLRSSGLLASMNVDENDMIIDSLVRDFGTDNTSEYLGKLEENINNVLIEVENALSNLLGVNMLDESFSIVQCRRFFSETGDIIRSGAEVGEYLGEYRRWIKKLNDLVDIFWQGKQEALKDISDEFKQPTARMHYFCNMLSKDRETANKLDEELEQAADSLDQLCLCVDASEAAALNPDTSVSADGADEQTVEDGLRSDDYEESQLNDSLCDDAAAPEAAALNPDTSVSADGADEQIVDDDLFSDDYEEIDSELDDYYNKGKLNKSEIESEPSLSTSSRLEFEEKKSGVAEDTADKSDNFWDEKLIEACSSGTETPEYYPMEFGRWVISETSLDGSASSVTTEDLARNLLIKPEFRNIQNLKECVLTALKENKTELAESLLYQTPDDAAEVNECRFLIRAQQVLSSTGSVEDLFCEAVDYLDKLSKENTDQSADINASVLTFLPYLCSRYMQIDAMKDLFETRLPETVRESAEVKNVENLLLRSDEAIDKEFQNNRRNVARRFENVVSQIENDVTNNENNEIIINLKKDSQTLYDNFIYIDVQHRAAKALVDELRKSLNYMFDSLKKGQILNEGYDGCIEPFTDRKKIIGYVEEVQRKCFSDTIFKPIDGLIWNKIIKKVNDLNDQYTKLYKACSKQYSLEYKPEDDKVNDNVRAWYNKLYNALKGILKCAANKVNELQNQSLKEYLLPLCQQDDLWQKNDESKVPELVLTVINDEERWPDDKRVTALMELSQVYNDFESLKQSSVDAVKNLQIRCKKAAEKLFDLKWANAIDGEEYENLKECLSRVYGWLKYEQNSTSELSPLERLRFEAEIWYSEQRCSEYIQRIAEAIKAAVKINKKLLNNKLSDRDIPKLYSEIDEAVKVLDVRGLMERFTDFSTDFAEITKLKGKESIASVQCHKVKAPFGHKWNNLLTSQKSGGCFFLRSFLICLPAL